MGCYNCEFLNKNEKKDGKINGCLYYCVKMEKYVNGVSDSCENYEKDYVREDYENNEIYNNGSHYANEDETSLIVKILLIIVLIIISMIVNR